MKVKTKNLHNGCMSTNRLIHSARKTQIRLKFGFLGCGIIQFCEFLPKFRGSCVVTSYSVEGSSMFRLIMHSAARSITQATTTRVWIATYTSDFTLCPFLSQFFIFVYRILNERFKSSEMLHHVDGQTVAGVSKDRSASIFRFKDSKQSSELLDFEDEDETSAAALQSILHNIPENLNLRQY